MSMSSQKMFGRVDSLFLLRTFYDAVALEQNGRFNVLERFLNESYPWKRYVNLNRYLEGNRYSFCN